MMKLADVLFFSENMKKILLIITCFLFSYYVFSQTENQATYGVELKTHYAFLMPHHKHMRILQNQHFPVYQLNFFKNGNFGREWQSLYNNPQHGFSVIYSPLSSPEHLGFGVGIFPFVNFHVFEKNKFSVAFFVGAGLGFVQKPFSIRENYKNEAVGSRFNAVLAGQADFRYRASASSEISAGLSLTHFSNGKIKTPNLGINNCGIFLGYAYHLKPEKPIETKPAFSMEKTYEFNFFFAGSTKQNYPVGGKNYLYTAYSMNVKRIMGHKRKIGAGLDMFYDYSDRAYFESIGFSKRDITYVKPAIYFIHDFTLSRVSILIHIGTYLYAFEKNQDVGMIYDRVGIQYYFNQNISTHIALKTHYAKADCIEIALNLSF